jgi:hypothetical protein
VLNIQIYAKKDVRPSYTPQEFLTGEGSLAKLRLFDVDLKESIAANSSNALKDVSQVKAIIPNRVELGTGFHSVLGDDHQVVTIHKQNHLSHKLRNAQSVWTLLIMPIFVSEKQGETRDK